MKQGQQMPPHCVTHYARTTMMPSPPFSVPPISPWPKPTGASLSLRTSACERLFCWMWALPSASASQPRSCNQKLLERVVEKL